MIATRIVLLVVSLAASASGCFDPTLYTWDADPVAESSSGDRSAEESSTATPGDGLAESTGDDSTSTEADAGESTDDSAENDSSTDDPLDAPCGDGLIGTDEDCDDANDRDGDGCSGCTTDPSWECHDEPSVCLETCGSLPQQCLHP